MRPATGTGLRAPAGLLVGAALWAAATQAGQILPYLSCGSSWRTSVLATFPAALFCLAAACVSWWAARPDAPHDREAPAYPASSVFVGRMSALAGVVFAYALALQGLSALVLAGCEL